MTVYYLLLTRFIITVYKIIKNIITELFLRSIDSVCGKCYLLRLIVIVSVVINVVNIIDINMFIVQEIILIIL